MEAWPLQVTANSNFPRHPSLRPAEPGGKERHPSLQPTFFLLPSPASDLQEQIPEDEQRTGSPLLVAQPVVSEGLRMEVRTH